MILNHYVSVRLVILVKINKIKHLQKIEILFYRKIKYVNNHEFAISRMWSYKDITFPY